jgi:predicted nuclease with RNAse H fold
MCCLEEDCPCRALARDHLKAAEREVLRLGISLYVTSKRSIIKSMAYRAIRLRTAIEECGIDTIEVYPFAAKVMLFGRPGPKKQTPAGRVWLYERLRPLVEGLPGPNAPLSHDESDAILAAYTAYQFGIGKAVGLGDPDEGLIYLPTTPVIGSGSLPIAEPGPLPSS